MRATIDVDLLLHLGYFKNVNLLSRGFYRVKVTLMCGSQKVVPVGMFAATSTYHSFVRGQAIDSQSLIRPAEVDDDAQALHTRVLGIRFKGESHELNEGVYWRFTLEDVDLDMHCQQGPKINQLLGVKFELQFCAFSGTGPSLNDDLINYFPPGAEFETVAIQRLMIQSLSSGMHQYFSVHFDGDHFSSLDAMFHACINCIRNVHYFPPTQIASLLPRHAVVDLPNGDQSQDMNSTERSNNILPPSKRVSTTIQSTPSTPSSSVTAQKVQSFLKLMSSPEKILFGRRKSSTTSSSSSSAKVCGRGSMTPTVTVEEGKGFVPVTLRSIALNSTLRTDLFLALTAAVRANYARAVQQSLFILNDLMAATAGQNISRNNGNCDLVTYNREHPTAPCLLQFERDQLELALTAQHRLETYSDLCSEVDRNIHICNLVLTARWSLLINSIKHVMKPIRVKMKRVYLEELSAFWKQQQIVYTRSYEGSHRLQSNKDEDLLSSLMEHIKYERESDVNACSVREQLRDEDGLYSSAFKSTIPVYARGMTIFDTEIHMIPSRLPYLFVEQYTAPQHATCDQKLPDESSTEQQQPLPSHKLFTGQHIIFLQHGFMGNSYDMRQLQQALSLLCPQAHTIIHCLEANESNSQDSIQVMADKLADELVAFCINRTPQVFNDCVGYDRCRVSFVGHSLGGLMIRLALQNPDLAVLTSKLHVLVTLASPHLGNLYSESQLVMTGMWALSKFNNCASLKELVMEEVSDTKVDEAQRNVSSDSTLLVRMSLMNTLSMFRKVILVCSPSDQYVPFHSARIQTTPRIESEAKASATTNAAQRIQQMVDNLVADLPADKLLRITVVNYNATFHVPPRFDDKAGKSSKERRHDASSTNDLGSMLMREHEGSVFDVNKMIGRSAHICYLQSPIVAFQLMISLQKYFVNQNMP